ncbi:hypothetical protein V7148_12650 [Gottfriedia acidiceleris]|nr:MULTISPECIES: hypothetical protein [unclassified Bacillus (in: firmicutes)]
MLGFTRFFSLNKEIGMKLSHGGNRTNGCCSVSVSGKWFEMVPYYV